MSDIEIKYHKGLNGTPALPLAVIGQAKIVEAGLSDNSLSLSWDNDAITAEFDGESVGVIAWSKVEHLKQAFIHLGFVLPGFRNRGVYRAMYDALVAKAREEKLVTIVGITHADNKTMRAAAQAMGRVERGIVLHHTL